jgi:hypothetical protein
VQDFHRQAQAIRRSGADLNAGSTEERKCWPIAKTHKRSAGRPGGHPQPFHVAGWAIRCKSDEARAVTGSKAQWRGPCVMRSGLIRCKTSKGRHQAIRVTDRDQEQRSALRNDSAGHRVGMDGNAENGSPTRYLALSCSMSPVGQASCKNDLASRVTGSAADWRGGCGLQSSR